MKTITGKIIALAIVMSGLIYSHSAWAACNTPGGLNSTGITSTSAVLGWNVISNAIGYNVQYKLASSGTWSSSTLVTSLSYTLTGLTPSTAYNWRVQTKCSATQTSNWSTSQSLTTLPPPCNVPTGLVTTAITLTSAAPRWTAVSGATGYNVRYRVVGAQSWTTTTTSLTSVLVSSLTASTNYEWQVQTNCGSSNLSAFSSSTTFNTLAVCNIPSGLNTTGINSTDAILNWSASTGAVGYNVQYRVVGAPSWIVTASATTSVIISALTASSNYEWQVQTNCGSSNLSGFSSSSAFTTAVTPPPACNIPAGLNTTGITSTAATLNWSAAPGAMSYIIRYRGVGTPSWGSLISVTTSITISSLNALSNYEWQVQTNCGNSNFSAFSAPVTFATSSAVCSIPSGLSSTGITATSAILNWSAVAGALGYSIQYRVVGAPSWTSAVYASLVTPPPSSVIISALTASSNYEWQVRTDCGNSNFSVFSGSAVFSTSATITVCNFPGVVSTANITSSSATLRWVPVANAAGYNIQYRQVGAGSWTAATVSPVTTITATSESFVVSSLTPSANYEWQVQTNCGNSNLSGFGILTTFTTSAATSGCNDIPSGLTAAISGPASATLNWSLSSSAPTPAGYNVEYRLTGSPSWTTVNTTTPSVTLSSLSLSGSYEWKVQTDCGSALSAFSAQSLFSMISHTQNTNTNTSPIAAIPDPQNPATWIAVFVSSGNAATDAQIVHDWLLAHGCLPIRQ